MKLMGLLRGDLRFQYRYGFYFVYVLFSLLYVCLLSVFPASWRTNASILMIFSDPAALGLFFMGAIVLFEKSERVLDSLAVSPVRVHEYVASKLLSLSVISVLVALLLAFFGGILKAPLVFISGVFLSSCFFSSLGLILAVRSATLNEFMLNTIPVEVVVMVPGFLYLFGWNPFWLLLHPGAAAIEVLSGGPSAAVALLILMFWTALSMYLSCRASSKAFELLGGIKL